MNNKIQPKDDKSGKPFLQVILELSSTETLAI